MGCTEEWEWEWEWALRGGGNEKDITRMGIRNAEQGMRMVGMQTTLVALISSRDVIYIVN